MRDYQYEDVVWWTTTIISDPVLYQIAFAVGVFMVAVYFGRD
jgi:hypothetical protein